MQILLIEDDLSLAAGLKKSLERESYTVNHVVRGEQGLAAISTSQPDIVILDLGLPDMDGHQVLSRIRKQYVDLPVLILTARNDVADRVAGLDLGADDYLSKPFDIDELLARLRVIERRASSQQHGDLSIDDVVLDVKSQCVSVAGKHIETSRREYMLIRLLMENAGRVLTRDSLHDKLYSWGEEVASNALEVHIHNLRKKVPEGFIKTIRGVGYIVQAR